MITQILRRMPEIRRAVLSASPLIHCITNPISINDCANALLAVGARPIMAEHPREVAEITACASALMLNLGNITDARMESMRLAGRTAAARGIPIVLDAVGVGCSRLRLDYARGLLQDVTPSVIKGNLSELRALAGAHSSASGVDAGERDRLCARNREETAALLTALSRSTGSVIAASGQTDLIADGDMLFAVENGSPALGRITGTGCVQGALCAAFLPFCPPREAALLATVLLGLCGERSEDAPGPGSFRTALLDQLWQLSDEQLCAGARIRLISA